MLNRKWWGLVAVAALVAALSVAAAATAKSTKHTGSVQVAVLLPDTQSSVRWETADRPFLSAAFTFPIAVFVLRLFDGVIPNQSNNIMGDGSKISMQWNLLDFGILLFISDSFIVIRRAVAVAECDCKF